MLFRSAQPTREGAVVHPADLDDALCLGALIAPSGGGGTRLPFAVDDAQLQVASGSLWAVRRAMRCAHRVRTDHLLCCLQGVERHGGEAVSVRLGGVGEQPQAQLDGFKSRALRLEASTPRHLYLTEWHSLDAAAAPSGATLVIGRETWYAECERWPSKTPRHELAATIGDGDWAVLVATLAITRE